jgi:glycosyltransferase involved in cell wall biosynthesis
MAIPDLPATRRGDRPRLLYLAMYDPSGQDSAPKVRIRLLGEALARRAAVETLTGTRLGRIRPILRWLPARGIGRVDAVYVESSTSTATPIDLAFLAWARLRGRPVGVYFRDAYQLYRHLYPRTRRRQLPADLVWRVTTPLLARVASVRYAPSRGLADALGLRDAVILPPGTEPDAPRLPVGAGPLVAYVGGVAAADGFDRLLAAMELVRSDVPDARLRVVGRSPAAGLPAWTEVRPGSRAELPERLADARVCVVPRPINPYTDLAMPVKVMDYLSLGRPVVATAATETSSFLAGTGAALLVADDPSALAAAIVRVLAEPGLAERMAAAAASLATRADVTWDGRAGSLLSTLLPAATLPG